MPTSRFLAPLAADSHDHRWTSWGCTKAKVTDYGAHAQACLAAVILMSSLISPMAAGSIEDAFAAVDRGDYATALLLFRSLADQHNARAQFVLGTMYANGQGVQQDYVAAMKWYRLSAGGTKPTQQSIEATKEEITVAARMHSECLNSPPAHVSLFFCLQVPLGRKTRREIARRVAQVVHDNMPPEGKSVEIRYGKGGLIGRPIAVDLIHINRVHPVDHHRWTWPEAGAVTPDAIALFEAAIEKKAKKLDACVQNCEECWLLIVAPSFKPSGMIHPDEHSLSHTYASPFSRTYFLDFGRGNLCHLHTTAAVLGRCQASATEHNAPASPAPPAAPYSDQ